MIEHFHTCNSNYPEKKKGEKPQATTDIDIGGNEVARTCNDCGAFERVKVTAINEEGKAQLQKIIEYVASDCGIQVLKLSLSNLYFIGYNAGLAEARKLFAKK